MKRSSCMGWLNLLSSNQDFESLNLVTAYSLIKYFNLLTKVIPKPGWHFQEERFLLRKGFKSLYCFSKTSCFQSKILIELCNLKKQISTKPTWSWLAGLGSCVNSEHLEIQS